MRTAKHGWLSVALLLGFTVVPAVISRSTLSHEPRPSAQRTPVLVELFTSEGCSSCPPADAFLSRLEAQQPVAGAEIIAIEEHVDYWDQLGWRDPFSSADWTERQRRYADVLGSGSVYTPQMIVNGSAEFVGSRERTGKDALEQAATRGTIPIRVSTVAVPGKHAAEVDVHIEKADQAELPSESDVWLAITESGLQSAVTRGDYADRDLRRAAV